MRDTRTLDPATWTAEERDRLIAFFRILLDWEAARPHTDGDTDGPDTRGERAARDTTTGAVLYARVSSKDQEREGFSIPAQQKLLRQYAREHGLAIVQEFVDVETAKQAGRGGFGEMLAFLKAEPVLPHDPRREDRPALPQHQGLGHGRRSRRRDPFRQGERGRLAGLALVRQVHARHQGADGEELRRQPAARRSRRGCARRPSKATGRRSRLSATSTTSQTHRIESDPVRGAADREALRAVRDRRVLSEGADREGARDGPHPPTIRPPMMKAEIHRILQNPIYTGEFRWLGKLYTARTSRSSPGAVRAGAGRSRSEAARTLPETAARLHGSADLRPMRLLDDRRAQEGQVHVLPLHRLPRAAAATPTSARNSSPIFSATWSSASRFRRSSPTGSPSSLRESQKADRAGASARSPPAHEASTRGSGQARSRVRRLPRRDGSRRTSGRGSLRSGRRSWARSRRN